MHESSDEHMLERILNNNEDLAAHNRDHFDAAGLLCINLMSAPGAGKTILLERSLLDLSKNWQCSVIEGESSMQIDCASWEWMYRKYLPVRVATLMRKWSLASCTLRRTINSTIYLSKMSVTLFAPLIFRWESTSVLCSFL